MVHLAPGKLLLFGEHAAVFGFPAVGIAIPRALELSIEPAGHWTFDHLDGVPVETLRRFAGHLERVAERSELSASERSLRGLISIRSSIPISSGFGSSAAFCAGIAALLLRHAGADCATPAHWRLAHELERFFHGTPSGIDTGLAVLGGVRSFHFKVPGALPETRTLAGARVYVVAGALQRSRSTKELVAMVHQQVNAGEHDAKRRIEQLGALACEAEEVLNVETGTGNGTPDTPDAPGNADTADAAAKLGRLADQAQDHLRALRLSTPELEHVLKLGRRLGATGGKLSGAGGGGAFYLVFADRETAQDAEANIEARLSASQRQHLNGPLFSLTLQVQAPAHIDVAGHSVLQSD